jgi:hypothetical protein
VGSQFFLLSFFAASCIKKTFLEESTNILVQCTSAHSFMDILYVSVERVLTEYENFYAFILYFIFYFILFFFFCGVLAGGKLQGQVSCSSAVSPDISISANIFTLLFHKPKFASSVWFSLQYCLDFFIRTAAECPVEY